jgi:hypothetical protein
MRRFDEYTAMAVVAATLVVATGTLVGYALYKQHQHNEFLREHGCQKQVELLTGQTVQVGKLRANETIIIYECADERRVEFSHD